MHLKKQTNKTTTIYGTVYCLTQSRFYIPLKLLRHNKPSQTLWPSSIYSHAVPEPQEGGLVYKGVMAQCWLIYKWVPESRTAHVSLLPFSKTHFFPLHRIFQVQLYAHCLLLLWRTQTTAFPPTLVFFVSVLMQLLVYATSWQTPL